MKTKPYYLFMLLLTGAGALCAGNPIKSSETVKNLKSAYTGESTASAKYAAYAQKADEEGYNTIALLFWAASKAESIHASNHKAVLQQAGESLPDFSPKIEVKSTRENLQDAIAGETYEITTMYPDFLKTANAESASLAMISFNYAYQTEKKHKAMYEKALKALDDRSDNALPTIYMVCSTCGNTYEGEAPDRCGISMTTKDRFLTIK